MNRWDHGIHKYAGILYWQKFDKGKMVGPECKDTWTGQGHKKNPSPVQILSERHRADPGHDIDVESEGNCPNQTKCEECHIWETLGGTEGTE